MDRPQKLKHMTSEAIHPCGQNFSYMIEITVPMCQSHLLPITQKRGQLYDSNMNVKRLNYNTLRKSGHNQQNKKN